MSGFKSVSNISDFIGYQYPYIFFLEAKSTQGNTFPLARLTQANELRKVENKLGVNAGIILWFRDHAKVVYCPIEEYDRLEKIGCKSINIKMVGDKDYNIYEIPGKLKRLFVDCDYTVMKTIAEEKYNKMINN